MKGRTSNATASRSFEISLAYLHGRIEHEIETFADRLSVNPLELAARLGALLSNAGEWAGHPLPGVPLAAGGRWGGDPVSPPLEVVIQSHGGEASHQTGAPAGAPLSKRSKKISVIQKAMWAKLTPRERTARTLARYEAMKHHSPVQKKAMATLRAKLAGKIPPQRKVASEKQEIYQARYEARKRGLPLPPLPGEKESPGERKKRLDRERHRQKRAVQNKATSKMATAAKNAWSGMTREQRQAEMLRRQQVAAKNKAGKAASEAQVVWNKPGKKNSQERPETEANA